MRASTLQDQHSHERASHDILVVNGSASPDVAIDEFGSKGVLALALRLNADYVSVTHDEDGLFRAGTFEPRDQAEPVRIGAHQLAGNAFAFEYALNVLGDDGLISGWVTAVDLYHRREVLASFGLEFLPVEFRSLRQEESGQEK
jgi:hypothetical protein